MTTWRWHHDTKKDGPAVAVLMIARAAQVFIARYHTTPTVAHLNRAQFKDASKQYGVVTVVLDKDTPPNTVDLEYCDPCVIQAPTIHELPVEMALINPEVQ